MLQVVLLPSGKKFLQFMSSLYCHINFMIVMCDLITIKARTSFVVINCKNEAVDDVEASRSCQFF